MAYFIFYLIGYWIFFSALSFLGERLLVKMGIVRGNILWLILASFFLALIQQINHNYSIFFFFFIALIAIPLSINRYDLSITISKGKWWWKSNSK